MQRDWFWVRKPILDLPKIHTSSITLRCIKSVLIPMLYHMNCIFRCVNACECIHLQWMMNYECYPGMRAPAGPNCQRYAVASVRPDIPVSCGPQSVMVSGSLGWIWILLIVVMATLLHPWLEAYSTDMILWVRFWISYIQRPHMSKNSLCYQGSRTSLNL